MTRYVFKRGFDLILPFLEVKEGNEATKLGIVGVDVERLQGGRRRARPAPSRRRDAQRLNLASLM